MSLSVVKQLILSSVTISWREFSNTVTTVSGCVIESGYCRSRTGSCLGVSGHRSGATGQMKGSTDGSAGAETELHSQGPEEKHGATGVITV